MARFRISIQRKSLLLLFVFLAPVALGKAQTSDRYGVVGVIAQKSSPQSKQSLAVIRDSKTNRNLVVRVGDKVPGGFVVKSIKQNEVRITSDGQDFILSPKSFDGVGNVAAVESSKDSSEFDDSELDGEFIEPPATGAPVGTPGERYTLAPGEIKENTGNPGGQEYPNTRRPMPPPAPPRTHDGFGRSESEIPAPPMAPTRESEFDDSFSGFEDLFDGP